MRYKYYCRWLKSTQSLTRETFHDEPPLGRNRSKQRRNLHRHHRYSISNNQDVDDNAYNYDMSTMTTMRSTTTMVILMIMTKVLFFALVPLMQISNITRARKKPTFHLTILCGYIVNKLINSNAFFPMLSCFLVNKMCDFVHSPS